MSCLQKRPVDPLPLNVGEPIRLDDGHIWTVRAVSANFVALTRRITNRERLDDWDQAEEYGLRPSEFSRLEGVGSRLYTVIDWRNGVRGPCNLIGQGWGDGTYSEAECAEMLAEFEAGDIEVSSRNWVRLDVRPDDYMDRRLRPVRGGSVPTQQPHASAASCEEVAMNLQPLLTRNRYTDKEWALASAGLCDRFVESDTVAGRAVRCEQPSDPGSFYRFCAECDDRARELPRYGE